MKIPDYLINELIVEVRHHYNVELTFEEAEDLGESLIRLVHAAHRCKTSRL